tara:strand:+ start:43 stop:246 length:204 start_codon:yes stop_codon:yes gene_type:complete
MKIGDLVVASYYRPTGESWYEEMYDTQNAAVVMKVEETNRGQVWVQIIYDNKSHIVMKEHLKVVSPL